MLLLAAASLHGLIFLLVWVILALVVIGLLWWAANQLTAAFGLPPWVPIVVLVVVVLVVLLWLADATA